MKKEELNKIIEDVEKGIIKIEKFAGLGRLSIAIGLPEWICDLTPREQKILAMRFGINDGITHTLEEVGHEFGVTREKIRQIEARAIEKLKYHNSLKR